jgi:adenylate cyclase class 2
MQYMNKEIEARFLDIDKQELTDKLIALGASDKGDAVLTEVIFYDQENKWPSEGRFVRIRSINDTTKLTYKSNKAQTVDSAREIEFAVPDANLAEQFLENIGLVAFRHQEKKRHTFELNDVTIDIDTWPKIPTYVELEGPSEEQIKSVAKSLGFKWEDAVFDDARTIIQDRYGIPMGTMRWFTFDKFE